MCGIAIIVPRGGISPDHHNHYCEIIDRMVRSIGHRGPDESNSTVTTKVAIGCARLEIVGGDSAIQPILGPPGCYTVCNGELYNTAELLKKSLCDEFVQSTSDCAPIAYMLRKYSFAAAEHLRGQFSFVSVDEVRDEIWLGRDRFGIHPLHYAFLPHHLIIASEAKAIFASGFVYPHFDNLAIPAVVRSYGPEPERTAFIGLRQIPQGHIARLRLRTWSIETRRYWSPLDLRSRNPSPGRDPAAAPAASFGNSLRRSIKHRLRGTGGVGIYLSGGVDSSTIAALVAAMAPNRAIAFSVEFPIGILDESSKQRRMIDHLRISQRSFLSGPNILNLLDAVVWHTEQPLIRLGPVPFFVLSSIVAEAGLKFVFSGEGADELLFGYEVLRSCQSSVQAKASILDEILGVLNEDLLHDVFYFPDYNRRLNVRANLPVASVARAIECETKLSRYLLSTQGDRVAAAHGIEVRYPFLDEDLWDGWALAQLPPPQGATNDGYLGKSILREFAKSVLPETIAMTPKVGYFSPGASSIGPWLLRSELIRDTASSQSCRRFGLFNVDRLAMIWQDLISFEGRSPSHKELEVTIGAILLVASTHLLLDQYADSQCVRSR